MKIKMEKEIWIKKEEKKRWCPSCLPGTAVGLRSDDASPRLLSSGQPWRRPVQDEDHTSDYRRRPPNWTTGTAESNVSAVR